MYFRTTSVAKDKKNFTNTSSFEWTVYPNPTTDNITLDIKSPENLQAMVELIDAQGKVIYSDNMPIQTGQNKKSLSLQSLGLKSGPYFIHLQPVGTDGEKKLIKEIAHKVILQ